MNIKQPPVYDISAWKEVADFALVTPRPLLFITKATEGASFVDRKFVRFFDGMKSIGVARGCFHFHRKADSATVQANNFIRVIRPHITNNDILILDVEEGGETAAQLKAWLDIVRAAFPNNQLMIYSRKNILDPIVMTTAQKEYFRQIPVWTAGYPTFPDLWNYPTGYIPDQSKWGQVWLWQYSDNGIINGIQGSVDLNWIDPIFAAMIEGSPVVPPPPPITGDTNMTWKTLAQVKKYRTPTFDFPTGAVIGAGVTFNVLYKSGDWLALTTGDFVNIMKSGVVAIVEVSAPPPPPPPTTTAVVMDRVDFTITENGISKKYYALNVPLIEEVG